jgi:hypothetical protein
MIAMFVMSIVSTFAMSMFVMSMTSSMFSIPLFIFFFTHEICFIPSSFDKYFESRIEMHDDDEEYEGEHSKNEEESNLYRNNSKPRDDGRDYKREYEKEDGNDKGPQIEKNHRVVELHRDANMPNCHPR